MKYKIIWFVLFVILLIGCREYNYTNNTTDCVEVIFANNKVDTICDIVLIRQTVYSSSSYEYQLIDENGDYIKYPPDVKHIWWINYEKED